MIQKEPGSRFKVTPKPAERPLIQVVEIPSFISGTSQTEYLVTIFVPNADETKGHLGRHRKHRKEDIVPELVNAFRTECLLKGYSVDDCRFTYYRARTDGLVCPAGNIKRELERRLQQ